jgi:Flp pilus assembly protein TadG
MRQIERLRGRVDDRPAPARDDSGAVTVEFAMALPVLLLVLSLGLWAIAVAGAAMSCTDAARAGARAAARGDAPEQVEQVARRNAPPGATVEQSENDSLVTVLVRARYEVPGPFTLPGITVTGAAVAEREVGTGPLARWLR